MARLEDRFPIYGRLIRLYPPRYREQYGSQMLQTFADMLDNAPTRQERAAIRLQTLVDFPLSLTRQELSYLGGIMTHDMPHYLKRNATIGAVLLAPFALAILANGLDKIINHQTLYHSWLWHAPFIGLWVLWLPLMATLLALATVAVYVLKQPRAALPRQLRVQYSWPILSVALIGLFILAVLFGHDSAHCLLGNPMSEVQHWHQTWQCITQGAANYPFQHPVEFLKRAFLG